MTTELKLTHEEAEQELLKVLKTDGQYTISRERFEANSLTFKRASNCVLIRFDSDSEEFDRLVALIDLLGWFKEEKMSKHQVKLTQEEARGELLKAIESNGEFTISRERFEANDVEYFVAKADLIERFGDSSASASKLRQLFDSYCPLEELLAELHAIGKREVV
ncbi:MAG: hypothetical protein H7318_14235 [Oligoflexus sp.]|nr:hypothetical protein [Oligoflexus sp.]